MVDVEVVTCEVTDVLRVGFCEGRGRLVGGMVTGEGVVGTCLVV